MGGSRSGRIENDLSRWPLMVVRFPRDRVDDDELRAFIEGQRQALGRRQKFAAIADAAGAAAMQWTQRRMLADWLMESEPLAREFTVAIAIVADNPLLRGGLAAVLWLKSPPCPTKVVTTTAEALDFCLDALTRAGVSGLEPAKQLREELEARKP